MKLVEFATQTCVFCKKAGVLELTEKEVAALHTGIHVQKALKNRDTGVREQVISGTHPDCWDKYLG